MRTERLRVGENDGEDPPVPIPNTVVKLTCAYDTWMATSWENRYLPTLWAPIGAHESPVHYVPGIFIVIMNALRAAGEHIFNEYPVSPPGFVD